MHFSNPDRLSYFRRRLDTLSRLFKAGRIKPVEKAERILELDALRWAIPILEKHAKESFEAQQEIERQNAAARAASGAGE